jgi:hypothetical protein
MAKKPKSLDYRSFREVGKDGPKKTDKRDVDKNWWAVPVEDRAASVTAVIQEIYNNDKIRQNQYVKSMRLYGNISPYGLSTAQLGSIQSPVYAVSDRLTYNVVQSAGDTVTAKIAKNKPKPLFLTSGGSYKLQRKAKKLDKYVEGIFYENDAYNMGPEIFRDSYVIGDGFTQVFAYEGRVKHERVLAGELFVDYADAINGKPRSKHRVKPVDADVLKQIFPDKEKEIEEAANRGYTLNGSSNLITDQVMVCESWHLPSGAKATDGRRSINILDGANLLDEEWKKDHFPFARLAWSKRMTGYFSQSGAEQIQPTQLEINKILWTMQRSYQLAGSFKVWLKIGSKIVKEHLNNDIGTILESEEMPQYLVPPIIQPEQYQHLRDLKNAAFEVVGVSQLSAQSKKPDGLDSGKALREYNNIETERFMLLGQAYENYFVQLAKLSVETAREIADEGEGMEVKSPNSKFIESIKWDEVDLPNENMITKIFPVSSLPSDPSGRLQTVQEYVQAGWLTPRAAKKLMDFPDIEMIEDLNTAKEDYLRMVIEKIIDEGEFTPPEPFDDLQLAQELFLEYYALGKMNGLEESKLEMLRTFNDQAQILITQASQPPQPPQADPAGGTPQGAPPPAPTSDLMAQIA